MSNKLNAEGLAINAYPVNIVTDTQNILDTEQVKRIGYAAAIREVAQPIADERDEYREALVGLVYDIAGDQHDFDEISKAFCPIVAARIESARAILDKYPKP
jgi:hypothetical protein